MFLPSFTFVLGIFADLDRINPAAQERLFCLLSLCGADIIYHITAVKSTAFHFSGTVHCMRRRRFGGPKKE